MYYDYFGFKQPPFRITPDTSLFYPGGDRGAILDALLYAILNGEGIIKVVGEVGSGKTMLCRMLEKELPGKVEVVYLVNPSISPENTLHAIAFELKLNVTSDTSRFEVMNALQQYLLQRHAENCQVVVFVEEAQSMPIATLEEIRLLSNLETQQSKLLQIVLFGQPELDEMISRPEIRQLKERITYSFQLAPFKTNDIREYMNTRIRACGYRSSDLFSDAAIKEIEQHSHGLLRRINILADKSLLAAFADNSNKVEVRHTRMAARDSEFITRKSLPRKLIYAGGAAALILLAVILIWSMRNEEAAPTVNLEHSSPGATPLEAIPAVPADPAPTPDPVADENVSPAGVTETGTSMPAMADNEVNGEALQNPGTQPTPAELARTEPVLPAAESTPTSSLTTSPAVDLVTTGTSEDTATASADTAPEVTIQEHELSTNIKDIHEKSQNLEDVNGSGQALESQLLGISEVYSLQDFGDNSLTESEAQELKRQLERLPPESVESEEPLLQSSMCRHCWSIIYRPLPLSKNL